MNISDITKRVLSENQPLQITFCKKFRNYLVYGLQPIADMSPDDPNFLVDSYAIMDINTGTPVYKSLFTKEFEDYFTQAVDVDPNGSEELKHYGVLGMKWGVRKDGKPQGYQGSGKKHSTTSSSNRQKKKESLPERLS